MNTPTTYGPHRVRVAATPSGAALDVRALVADVLVELVTNSALFDLFTDWADAIETGSRPDPYAADPLRLEHLLDQLDTSAYVYGAEVGRLAEELAEMARPKALPVQQDRRAS